MNTTTTYLERPAHGITGKRFYEVGVHGRKLTVRFGRVGYDGRLIVRMLQRPAEARAEAERRVQQHLELGFKRRKPSGGKAPRASTSEATVPVVWHFPSGAWALGIHIDETHCWIGNNAGNVYCLTHKGQVMRSYKLPMRVMALVGDGAWMYAGCDDGNIYDLTGKTPRLAYELPKKGEIDWIDIWGAVVAVSTQQGTLDVIDVESQPLWHIKAKHRGGFTVRCDRDAVYHGHDDSVTAYRRTDGKKLWSTNVGSVMFGWQTAKDFYAGTSEGKIVRLAKKDGKKLTTYHCDTGVWSCATTPDGSHVFGGDSAGWIYCFDASGKRLWKLKSSIGATPSMQVFDKQLFITTGQGGKSGELVCIDISDAAIQKALAGHRTSARRVHARGVHTAHVSRDLETTTDPGNGVVLVCVRDGTKLRMHVESKGYNRKWWVQFPRDIREEGARYVVDEVRVAAQGGFYRAIGDIKKLVPAGQVGS